MLLITTLVVTPSSSFVLTIDLVLDRVVARRGSCPFDSRESSIFLSALFRDCYVVDIWRLKHPDGSRS